jgi:hypothetical protein
MTERCKMIYLARRNPGLRADQFSQAWREHSALGAGCTNVRDKVLSVMQCSRVLDGPPLPGSATDYDGVNLLALGDVQAATDIWADPETLAIMRPDEPRVFSTYVREFTLVCGERVLRDVPRGTCCVVGFLKAGAGVDSAALGALALDAADLPGAGRVVWNGVQLPPPPGYDYDLIAEWWYPSAEAARASLDAQDVRQALAAGLRSAVDAGRSVFMFTQVTHSRP